MAQKYVFLHMVFLLRWCFIVWALALVSCSVDRWEVPTDGVPYRGVFLRLDRDIFALDPEKPAAGLEPLRPVYGDFLEHYFSDIMQVGSAENEMAAALLMRFTTDPVWEGLQRDIEQRFPDLSPYEQELTEAFKRYAVHFGADTLPTLVAYNSGFNVGIFPTPTYLGIGLEWYAGGDMKVVQQLPPDLFPQYKRDKMQPAYLSVNALRGWLMVRHQHLLRENHLLGEMLYAGKVLYLTAALIPRAGDDRVLNYTQEQLRWCERNEWDIWKHLLEQDILFTNAPKTIQRYIGDGPFTPGMPAESPGGVGNWLGYRMVKAYMDKNRSVGLRQMLEQQNHQEFLKAYKPGK